MSAELPADSGNPGEGLDRTALEELKTAARKAHSGLKNLVLGRDRLEALVALFDFLDGQPPAAHEQNDREVEVP